MTTKEKLDAYCCACREDRCHLCGRDAHGKLYCPICQRIEDQICLEANREDQKVEQLTIGHKVLW